MAILSIVVLLIVIGGVFYFNAGTIVGFSVAGITLLLVTLFGNVYFLVLLLFWILFIAVFSFTYFKEARINYFTKPFANAFQKHMPSISKTEQEAIEAGDVWWEKDLFSGNPDWKKLLAYPKPTLSKEEQDFVDNQVETVCSMLNDWQVFHDAHDIPKEVWNYFKKEKFFGMIIPKNYDGLGFSAIAHSTVVVKIASRCGSAAVNSMVPNSLGPGELLLRYGTEEQKNYYLPRLARGEEIPCFALTGPEAGSDAAAISDSGIVCRGKFEGKEVLGFRLTWNKRYITLAPIATVLGIAFRLYDPEHLLGKEEDIGITLCLVPTSHPGVKIGDRHLPMGLAFMNGPTSGKDVFVPMDWIIGGVGMAGHGWQMLMESLSVGRSISLPALSTSFGKLAYRMTGAYARMRRQFNTSIANFEGVEGALGNIAGLTYILNACRIMTAGAVDQKLSPAIVSAIAKYHMTEMSREVIMHAMDVHAGHGVQTGPRNVLAITYCSLPVSITVEGANILTRNLIIYGQGAIRCHPFILREINLLAAADKEENLVELDKILLSHIHYAITNVVRTVWFGLTGGNFISSPVSGAAARYYRQLTRMSSALALFSDVTMLILGGALKRKEYVSARLGDILSQLYLASTVLKYYSDQGQPVEDLDYVRWGIEMCLHRIQTACDDLLNNFPIPWLGKVLYWLAFPWGTAYRKASDTLYHKIVQPMLAPSAFRDRLTQYFYLSKNPSDATSRMDAALVKSVQADPLVKKFQAAVRGGKVPAYGDYADNLQIALKEKILTADEVRILSDYHALYKEIITVDEFSFDFSSVLTPK